MLTLQEAANALRTRVVGDAAARFMRVSTDSRDIRPGDLFVALKGDTFDGHDFAQQAILQGAVGVMAHRLPTPFNGNLLLVNDTRIALGELAAWWRRQFTLPVIAVTGSNGKTTVKEMIASILSVAFGTPHRLATQGNLNNDIGVPLTLLRLNAEHRAAVVELGMNHPGEISELAHITQPTVALVNNAQREHQEFMQSVEAVARENGAVFNALPPHGVAVFPTDTPHDALWRQLAGKRRILTFGASAVAQVRGKAAPDGHGLRLHIAGTTWPAVIPLQALGEHNVRNAEAAAACAYAAGIAFEAIAEGLARFQPVAGRLVLKRLTNGALVIDDTYNANPDSVRAAIDVLATLPAPRLLILGDMGEVGDQGPAFHTEVGAYARERGIDGLVTVGTASQAAARAYGPGAVHFAEPEQAMAALGRADPSASVLVKGSRFMRMERVVASLCG